MMAVHEDGVAIETRDETDDSERMVIIGTDEIQVHPDLSTTQTSGKKRLNIYRPQTKFGSRNCFCTCL